MKIILGSKSPRRRELLNQIGVTYECIVGDEEEIIESINPEKLVKELSLKKAMNVCEKVSQLYQDEELLIISADTIVAYNNRILGKPQNEEEAFKMIHMLQGNQHQVYTGVAVIYRYGKTKRQINFYECTQVYMKKMGIKAIKDYIKTGEPMDKAGSYAIQGLFAVNIEKIKGDYNNVVGLPISRIYFKIKEKLGIDIVTRRHIIKACIFDLDGTTLDTVKSISVTANRVLEEMGLQQNPEENYKQYAGDGQIELIKRALIAAGDTELKTFDKAMNRYIQLFETGCTYEVKPYEGICELFEELKRNDIKIIIFSNKANENVCSVLDDIFGKHYFDFVLGQRDDYKRKPSKEGIDIILKEIDLKPEQCLYIGDTSTDMQTGKGGGLYTIGVTWGFREKEELLDFGADKIINHPLELLDLI